MPKIKAPLLIHYAGKDTRINDGWPAYETALKAAKRRTTTRAHVPDGAQHGFNNDTTPRYDEDAAKLAWTADRRLLQQEREEVVSAAA